MAHLLIFVSYIGLVYMFQLSGNYWTVQDRIASYVIIGFTLTLSSLARFYENIKDKEE